VSSSLSYLRVALREFIDRPLDEEVDLRDQLDVADLLEGALDSLYQTRAEREEELARRPELEAIAKSIALAMTKRQAT